MAPDVCQNYDWNPITTAGHWVPFTGGIAGFIFTGIIFLLGTRPEGDQEAAARAFKLLITAFFGFVTLAYLTAAISGEQTCKRADTLHAFIGGILATSIILMSVALSWLLVAYSEYGQKVLPFYRGLIYFALTLASVMLAVSSAGYLYSVTDADPGWHYWAVFGTAFAAILVGAARVLGGASRPSPDQGGRVSRLAVGSLVYLAVASVGAGLMMSIPPGHWDPPALWASRFVAWSALLIPLGVLYSSIGAIARPAATATRPRAARWFRRAGQSR